MVWSQDAWKRFDDDAAARLVEERGSEWRILHQITGQFGNYFCNLCRKHFGDLRTVDVHCKSQKHMNKYNWEQRRRHPLAEIPEDQHAFVDVTEDGKVKCMLCAGSPECTLDHLASDQHELFFLGSFHKIKHKRKEAEDEKV